MCCSVPLDLVRLPATGLRTPVRPGRRAIVRRGHSEAVPFSQRQPGEELTAILPVALDQLDFGRYRSELSRPGEEPEGVPPP